MTPSQEMSYRLHTLRSAVYGDQSWIPDSRGLDSEAWAHAAIGAYCAMTKKRRNELRIWKQSNPEKSILEWPIWESYIGPPPWVFHKRSKRPERQS